MRIVQHGRKRMGTGDMITNMLRAESWALTEPFEISRVTITEQRVIAVTLFDAAGHAGCAEAAGVDYAGETVETMTAQIRSLPTPLDDAISAEDLQRLLPPGGARNAVDCALWDLHAKQSGIPAWRTAGLPGLRPLLSAYTIGLGSLEDVQRKALQAADFPLFKLKVDARRHVDLVRAIREVRADARIVVDANQAWSVSQLRDLLPELDELGVELIEQPLPSGRDAELRGFGSPIPLAADESCTDADSLDRLAGCYDFVNIKLDKCGGLTEAMKLADRAAERGLGLMIGNMCGTSLAMAPAFLVGQRCRYVDLDGPLLQRMDRKHRLVYRRGFVEPPLPALWG